ncbi:MAG: polysaccharide deacetylase family protein [Anaerolineaceae bacterium]|nr:polysaccharide deacetylase family protein [Anaerolineaceae bacterium]
MNLPQNNFYLSFDGSPNPPATDRLLNALANYGIMATFFMEGIRLENEPDCARRVQAAGHDIGNHSYNHPEFDKISIQEAIIEVELTQQIIFRELGFYPTLLRPPAGLLTQTIEETFLSKGFDIVLWSYSVRDWEGPDAKAVTQRILSQAIPGAIIALHDRTEWLIEILENIIPALRLKGYQFRKISQIEKKGVIKFG